MSIMSINSDAKLYVSTSPDFRTYSHVSHSGKVITMPAGQVPMILWPDGRWCIEANLYIESLLDNGLSHSDRGSSLHTYATQITHLLRFCSERHLRNSKVSNSEIRNISNSRRINLHEITDNDFSLFMEHLGNEKKSDGSKKRIRDSNIAIGRRCLSFLSLVGKYHDIPNFLGEFGRIRAIEKISNSRYKRTYWHHRSIPASSAKKRRSPISLEHIQKLYDAAYETSSSLFLRKRRFLMLTLLEVTGARRSEVKALTVESVYAATKMEFPALELITKKIPGGDAPTRLVPIQRSVLIQLVEFIEKNRAAVIRRTCGRKKDSGVVLISETTGKPLVANTITTEIALLRLAAKLEGRAHAHMFRHAFITRLFKTWAEQYSLKSIDDLRTYLFEGEKLKRIVAEWTGHRSIDSLEIYIHLAFEGSKKYPEAIEKIWLERILESSLRAADEVQKELRESATSKPKVRSSIEAFSNRVSAMIQDIANLDGTSKKTPY